MSSFEIISDYSKANLKEIPQKVLEMNNLKMLFLERNQLKKLPNEFFYKLPNLMWLDLRNNLLEYLPKSIAHHQHLEHLLLTNNNIQKLPNELGLVPNLKALQVADNPIIYPARKIIQEGTKSIKKFLKEQYELVCTRNADKETDEEKARIKKELWQKEHAMEMIEETLIKVHNEVSEFSCSQNKNGYSNETFYTANNKMGPPNRSKESAASFAKRKQLEVLSRKLSDPKELGPTLYVKKLDHPNKKSEEPLKIIHSINKSDSKISLKSYFNKGIRNNLDRIPENTLKEGWLNKLRILLNDQERILQQERNLKALAAWRQKTPDTPKTFHDDASTRISEAPYATYEEYSKIPSRRELSEQLQSFLQESGALRSRPVQTSSLDLDKLINDLVEQLKEMESTYSDTCTPRTEMEQVGKQIQTIMDIHKKLLKLKTVNDFL